MHPRPFRGRFLPTRFLTLLGLLVVVLLVCATSGRTLLAQSVLLPIENSWVRIQNVGTSAATIQLEFYDQSGALVAIDRCPEVGKCGALEPGFGWSFFQQSFDDLEEGYQGSAYITVDQPFVSMLARDTFLPDGSFQIGGDALRLGGSGGRQFLPIVENTDETVSGITIKNTNSMESACVGIRYFEPESLAALVVDPPMPGEGCSSGGVLLGPRATWVRDETSLPIPIGFDGSAVVDTFPTDAGVAASEQTLSVIVDTRARNGPGLATYRSFGEDELSHVVVLPLVDRNATQGQTTWSTRFRILGGTPEVPNEVTLLFDGKNAEGDQIEIEHSILLFGALTCDQRADGIAGCLPLGETLPSTFFGTVRMESLAPIAVVAQRLSADGAFADYRGFTAEEASRQVVLPVVNKNFGPWGGFNGWNSWFRVLSFDGSAAQVTVIYYSKQFPDGLFPSGATTVGGQRTFVQWEHRVLPDGWVGSAVIVADRPVVVVANLESDVFGGDPVMLYNGVSLE